MNKTAKYPVGTKATFFGQPVLIHNSCYSEFGGWYYDIFLFKQGEVDNIRIEEEYLKSL